MNEKLAGLRQFFAFDRQWFQPLATSITIAMQKSDAHPMEIPGESGPMQGRGRSFCKM